MRRRAGYGLLAAAFVLLALSVTGGILDAAATSRGKAEAPVAPRLLSETGLYSDHGTLVVDPLNRPFTPQYPLWSDGAGKRRWVRLPKGATIDVADTERWEFPVGTRFWKEFEFGGRKVETRFFWKARQDQWVFASYAWNDAQTDAVLAPPDGIANVAEVAPGRFHSIPGVADCRACHDSATRTEVLGFDALQLSTDRDPNALHAEPLAPGMVTLRELAAEGRLSPTRPELLSHPPRIPADDARTRTALGYLSTNCGSCHNRESSIASLGLWLKWTDQSALDTTVDRRGHWVVPTAPPGESRLIVAGRPDLSALVARVRSRRAASQMPPLGTVVADQAAVDLLSNWVAAMTPRTSHGGTETRRNTKSF